MRYVFGAARIDDYVRRKRISEAIGRFNDVKRVDLSGHSTIFRSDYLTGSRYFTP